MKQIIQLEVFKKEIAEFPLETREDIFSLIYRFLSNERLSPNDFKTFNIDKNTRIQEFKVNDSRGNWRAISCLFQKTHCCLSTHFIKNQESFRKKIRMSSADA